MLMNFSSKRKGVHATPVFFPGRTGHRAARINDSIFVVGGTDKTGRFVNEVHRINCLNNRIDSLILENTISIEGFSLFSFQETLFIWGGLRLREHINLLLQFDGNRFVPIKQQGSIPVPRAYHASVTFGGKYLILFGGSDQLSFFNDWNLLNLKTMQWRTLTPSLEIKHSLNCSMVWTNGRGILLVNQLFDQTSGSIIANTFYEFYVSDFNQGHLKVLPLQLTITNSIFQDYIFNHMAVSDHNSILIFGGYRQKDPNQLHNLSYILSLDHLKLEKSKFRCKQKSEFESIYHKNKLYIIGGILGKDEMEEYLEVFENSTQKHNFRRHVCNTCKLYFDQEWFKTSKEAFPTTKVREDYDYNYHLRVDNRILAKFSTYITNELYALSLIIQTLQTFTANHIQISFNKKKQRFSEMIPEMSDSIHHFLKIGCTFNHVETNAIINEFLMVAQRQSQSGLMNGSNIELGVLRLKISSFRIGKACLISLRVSKEEVCIIYFSCSQLECTNSNFHPFTNYHYYYNTKTKECSSRNNRHIIYENVKQTLNNLAQFEDIGDLSMSMLIFCGDEMQSELVSYQHSSEEGETGESALSYGKELNRKIVPLMQFSFLPTSKLSNILIEQAPINFINILDLLKGDLNSKILERIECYDCSPCNDIFQKMELFYYPCQYWFRRVLVYHCNRLIMHFQQDSLSVCGVIVLKASVELDLSGNHLCSLAAQQKLSNIVNDFKNLKRTAHIF